MWKRQSRGTYQQQFCEYCSHIIKDWRAADFSIIDGYAFVLIGNELTFVEPRKLLSSIYIDKTFCLNTVDVRTSGFINDDAKSARLGSDSTQGRTLTILDPSTDSNSVKGHASASHIIPHSFSRHVHQCNGGRTDVALIRSSGFHNLTIYTMDIFHRIYSKEKNL